MRATLLVLALLVAGCTSAPHADPVEPTSQPESPAAAPANASASEPLSNSTLPANRTAHVEEKDIAYTYYAIAPPAGDTGNMRDAEWQVDVPPGATQLRALANVTATAVLGQMWLMVHAGTLDRPGKMFAGTSGLAGLLATNLTAIPPGTTTVVVMCHPDGDTPAAGLQVAAHLRVEFT